MAVWSTITTSQIEYSRIDADFYHPQYLNELATWHALSQRMCVSKLGQLISTPVRTGRTPRLRSIRSGEPCVIFIKTNNVRAGAIDFKGATLLPRRVLNATDFIPDDAIVVTIIGATPEIVGRAAIVREEDQKCVTNQNVAVIVTNELCDAYFLTAYLQTDMGRDQLWRHSRRTEQVNLNCREVERILVPCPACHLQTEIGDLVRQSFLSADCCDIRFAKARQLFESELGLDKLTFHKPVGYTSLLSEVISNGRADADYFQVNFRQIHEQLDTGRTVPLHQLADISKGIEVGSSAYRDNGRIFLRVSNIKEMQIQVGASDKYISDTAYQTLLEYRPTIGELLLTKDGSPGICLVVDEELDGIISGGIVRLKPHDKRVPNEYLALAINSRACRMQVEQECSGALILHWKPSSIRKLRIPLLPDKVMANIADLVMESKQAKRESIRLLHEAKTRVEQLIEKAVQS